MVGEITALVDRVDKYIAELRAENERLKTLVRAATKLIDPVEQYRWHDEARAALEQKP